MVGKHSSQVKSKKSEGKEVLKRYTRARQNAFNKWKRYGQVFDSEGEEDSEDGNDNEEEQQRIQDLESGKQVTVRQGFVEW